MTGRRTILLGTACLSVALLTVKTLSQPSRSSPSGRLDLERLRNMTEEEKQKEMQKWREEQRLEFERFRNMSEPERKRYLERKRRQRDLELKRKSTEASKKRAEMAPLREQRKLELDKERAEWKAKYKEEKEAAGGFIFAKYGLDATEEQWKLIREKLEKVRQLRDQANSGIGARLVGGSSAAGTKAGAPAFQWKKPWDDKSPDELTEAQRLARQLVALLERQSTTPQAFRRKIADLRKARLKESEIEKQLADARRELREVLTTRQEAVLVLMGWL